jgi:MFS family permease
LNSIAAAVGALLAGMFMLLAGNGLLGTLVGVRTAIENFPTWVTGIVMSSYFVGMILGTFWCRPIIERVGHIRAFAAFSSMLSVVPLLHAFAVSPWSWAPLRLTTGFCYAGIYMVAESWMNARATRETRGRILSLYMMTSYLAQAAGQFLLLVGDPATNILFAIISVLLSLAAIPIALTRADPPSLGEVQRLSVPALFRISPLAVIGAVAAGLANSALYGMGPIFARLTVQDLGDVSTFMFALIMGGLVLQYPLGRMSDRIDRRVVILVVAVAAMLAAIGIVIAVGRSEVAVVALVALFGGMSVALYSLCVAHANDFTERGQQLAASAGLLLVWGIGAMFGPMVAAGAMQLLGPRGMFEYLALIYLALLLVTLYRMSRRPTRPAEERQPFVAVPTTTAKSLKLDPRSEDAEQKARREARAN